MADISIIAAFAAGTISFLSPCVLPLVPGYISIVSGISLDRLQSEAGQNSSLKRIVIFNSIFFILGFSVTFITLGASATLLGSVLLSRPKHPIPNSGHSYYHFRIASDRCLQDPISVSGHTIPRRQDSRHDGCICPRTGFCLRLVPVSGPYTCRYSDHGQYT